MPAYLLTWNPERFLWESLAADVRRLRSGKDVTGRWSAGGTKHIRKGDRLFLLRQGIEPKGIIGMGIAISDWYEDAQWDRDEQNTTYVDVKWVQLAEHPIGLLSAAQLSELVPGLRTNLQRSGTLIADDLVVALEQLSQPDVRLKLRRTDEFPRGITAADVKEAIATFNRGIFPPTFGRSTDFDLLVRDRRYPPKVVAGLAARRARGRIMFSQEFRGGEATPCFHLLTDLGFTIVPKSESDIPFVVGQRYTRRDIQQQMGLAPTEGGDWATGHHREGNDTFIFATVGAAGRTGHRYDNHWQGADRLHWESKATLTQTSSPIKSMLRPPSGGRVFIFTREHDREAFTFNGLGTPESVDGEKPVKIVWRVAGRAVPLSIEDTLRKIEFIEGKLRDNLAKVRSRSAGARRACLEHHGYACVVCGLNFLAAYGERGRGYIHVHHLDAMANAEAERTVDAAENLRPVCPNCHAMLHAGPLRSIEELRSEIKRTAWYTAVQSFMQSDM